MIICFNCSPETKNLLEQLIETGEYEDYGEVIASAVMNLSVLQQEILKKGSIVIGTDNEVNQRRSDEYTSYNKSAPKKSNQEVSSAAKPLTIPPTFHLDGLTNLSPPLLMDLPDDIWAKGQEIPLDRWIFGQHNKLLPAKASCRALAHLLTENPKGVLLEEATQHIAEQVTMLGNFLTQLDEQNGIARDEAFSTAFPTTGKGSEKSRLRYSNQFIASVNKQGQISGLLIDYKFINSKGGKKPQLLLTEVGWQFAIMPNPVLDDIQETSTQKFSHKELDFLLRHIAESVPVEDFAYQAILRAITEGANTPDALDTALQKNVPRDSERSLSKSFLSSQRSGAISRMTDLGLVERVRDGVRVSYIVTEIGEKYMRKSQQHFQGGHSNE